MAMVQWLEIAQQAIARSRVVAIGTYGSGHEENRVSLKYLIYSANKIMYKLTQVAGQMGGRQLTLRGRPASTS
jgi:hypothetical protein